MFGFENEYAAIPDDMQLALLRYARGRVKPGGFVEALASNDLRNAIGRADQSNAQVIGLYVLWFVNEAPADCHGSVGNYSAWIAGKLPKYPIDKA